MLDKPVPIFRQLADIDPSLKLTDLAVFGVVYLYSQMSKGYCYLSFASIGKEVAIDEKTVDRSIKKLVNLKIVVDLTPNNNRKIHNYVPSEEVSSIINCSQNDYSLTSQTVVKMTTDDKNCSQNDANAAESVVKMSDNSSSSNPVPGGNNELEIIQPPEQPSFTIAYNRWVLTFGDLETGQRMIFGDYFDDLDCKPEWVLKAVNETIAAAPKGAPFRYFKRIIDGYITTGGPVDREPAKPPVKKIVGNGNGHISQPSTATPQTGVGEMIGKIKIVGRA